MNGTLVDANVFIDVFDADAEWHSWSADALLLAAARGPVILNPIVYGEIAASFEEPSELEWTIGEDIQRRQLPWMAAFLAGKAFQSYRRRGGMRSSPLPDFYIGAHAAVERLDILTRDPRRFTSYFPTVTVISPSEA